MPILRKTGVRAMSKTDSGNAIFKKVLSNGLTVLVRPNHVIPKVSTQLWYNVGSKDEKDGQKGLAHLIEHMIFKGTKKLSESDINMITHKLSGYCNAFTSYDYTGYLFDFPSQNWHEALPIMADCMRNCTFKEEFLASEMKAVIQELKMYKDDYTSSLLEEMISSSFVSHPYHYPIIGFKQDLWNANRDVLMQFYQQHYVPNNAVLVIVGDVQPDEVFALAQKEFGHIPANPDYKKEEFYIKEDLIGKAVTLYRDVQQPTLILSWLLPGARERVDYFIDVLGWVLGKGKGSVLYNLLVDQLELATDIEAFNYDLFDKSPFFIYCKPKSVAAIPTIIEIINRELDKLKREGIKQDALERAVKQTQTSYLSVLEDNQKQAYVIGQSYLVTGDENFLFNYLDHSIDEVTTKTQELLQTYFRKSLMNYGTVLPMDQEDKPYWQSVQKISDQEDARILSKIKRTAEVEQGVHVHAVQKAKPKDFIFPRANKFTLKNGIKVYSYHNANIPKIELILNLQAKHFYDPEHLQGLYSFVTAMMLEGSKHYPGNTLADAFESRGMSISIVPGQISFSMLSQDFKIGLELLMEVLQYTTFEDKIISKVKEQFFADLKEYWDEPISFVGQLARNEIYKNHPYSKKILGDFDSIKAINKADLIKAYEQFLTPDNAVLAVVGDIKNYNVEKMLEETIGAWQGPKVSPIIFPSLVPVNKRQITYQINRDQTVLAYVGLSINRFNKMFDNILLFDQIFAGGVLGSMSSRLFELRERSGLFYTIGGSLMSGTDEQPGMMFIRTIVSNDRLQEAETAITNTIKTAADSIGDHELEQAKDAVTNSLIDNFSSNKHIASTFLFLHRFNMPEDYFDHRARQLNEKTKPAIITDVKSLLNSEQLITIKIGRIE